MDCSEEKVTLYTLKNLQKNIISKLTILDLSRFSALSFIRFTLLPILLFFVVASNL